MGAGANTAGVASAVVIGICMSFANNVSANIALSVAGRETLIVSCANIVNASGFALSAAVALNAHTAVAVYAFTANGAGSSALGVSAGICTFSAVVTLAVGIGMRID